MVMIFKSYLVFKAGKKASLNMLF